MAQLYIPNSVALRNFDTIFKDNDFDFSGEKVSIRFHPKYVAMHPVGLAFYAAVGDLLKMKGIETDARIAHSIRSIPYLQRMGLFKALSYNDPLTIENHEETGRFIPLTKIHNSTELEAFLKQVDPILHTTPNTSRVIKHVFSELLRNVIEHSGAPFGGNVCASYNKKRKKISVGISDAGMGIREGMRGYKCFAKHLDAICSALTPGISGTTKRIGGTAENAGAGLFFTKCIAQTTRNHFVLYSGDSYFKLRADPLKEKIVFKADPQRDISTMKESLPNFPGTVVGLDIHIEDDEAFNRLMDRIGDAYKLSVKKSKRDYHKRIKFT